MGTCAKCKARMVDGIRRHHPACPFYRAVDMLTEHPDLLDLDLDLSYWFPDEAWPGPAARPRRFAA